MIVGLVLAGGRSSRFGREKALAELHGRPFIAHVVDVLSQGCERVAINAREDSLACAYAQAHGLATLSDTPGDPDGPLSGVKAGLIWAKAQGAQSLATAPCDTPFLPHDLVLKLAAADRGCGAVARTADGLQPLCALWPVGALDALAATLAAGEHPSIKHILLSLDVAEATFDEAGLFDNLNTPDDYRSALRRGPKRER
jgi:molybdopterin-guanine dinucleotide biosynthesis protein A